MIIYILNSADPSIISSNPGVSSAISAFLIVFIKMILADFKKKKERKNDLKIAKEAKDEEMKITENSRAELNSKVDVLILEMQDIKTVQNEQIKIAENLEEDMKATRDSRKLNICINEAYESVITTFDVKDEELLMATQNAKDGVLYVLSDVFAGGFTTNKRTLEKQLINKAKSVKKTCTCEKIKSLNADYLEILTRDLKSNIKSFMLAYEKLQNKNNGVRRKDFINESVKFVENCMTSTFENY